VSAITRVDGGGRRVGRPLLVVGAEVGRDRDRVERATHALGDPIGHPVVGGPAGGHAHEAAALPGKHLAPDVEIALRLAAGHLPVVEAGVFGPRGLRLHPMRCLEAPAEVPDLVRPFDVGLASRLEVLADIRREVADERVIGHVRHVEPRVGVEFVGQAAPCIQPTRRWRAARSASLRCRSPGGCRRRHGGRPRCGCRTLFVSCIPMKRITPNGASRSLKSG
jgi:hypothetical protein